VYEALEGVEVAWIDYVPNGSGGMRVGRYQQLDGPRRASRSLGRLAGRRNIPWPSHRNPRVPRRKWVDRFTTPRSDGEDEWNRWRESEFYDLYFAPERLVDQCRMLVYDRRALVGWIGGFTQRAEGIIEPQQVRRANLLREAVSTAVTTAAALERADIPEEAGDILLDVEGTPLYWTAAVRPWLEAPETERRLVAFCRALEREEAPAAFFAQGLRIRWSRVDGPGPGRYLLHVAPSTPVERDAAYLLTDAELRTGELLANGATIPEAAAATGVGVETARTHARNLYRKLGVRSRAELKDVLGRD
jgi:DNA-binding CsgD family transcriptional regulator